MNIKIKHFLGITFVITVLLVLFKVVTIETSVLILAFLLGIARNLHLNLKYKSLEDDHDSLFQSFTEAEDDLQMALFNVKKLTEANSKLIQEIIELKTVKEPEVTTKAKRAKKVKTENNETI